MFNSFLELRIFSINEVNPSQPASVVKLRFFSIAHFCFSFRCAPSDMSFPISGRKYSGLDVVCFFASRSPDHVYLSGGFSSNVVNRVYPVHESDRSRSPSIFQQSSMRRSSTSKVVLVALVTSMYRGGIGNDSSLRTYSSTLGSA